MLRVHLSVPDGEVWFTTCPRCESRRWERDGSVVPLSAMLEAVGKR